MGSLLAAVLVACGGEPGPRGDAAPAGAPAASGFGPGAVLRLAERAPPRPSPVLVHVTGVEDAALEVLAPDGELAPRADRAPAEDDRLVVLFELPPGDAVSVVARLGAPDELVTTEPCRDLRLVRLRELEDDESLDSLRAAGGLPHPSGRREPLGRAVLRVADRSDERSLARWATPPAADGLAAARFVLPVSPRATVWAAVVGTDGSRPPRLGELSVVRKPLFERFTDGLEAPDAAPALPAPRWLDLKVGGELRACLVVPGGGAAELEVDPPAGAARLEFGVCIPPGHPLGAAARWSVEAGGRTLARGALVVRDREPLRNRFDDVVVGWDGGAGTRLAFRVEGEAAVAFGAPVVLAPPDGPRPPNLLLVSLDTLRADRLGCYGYDRPTSPWLDAFASRAVRFADARTVAPYTLPSHVTLFTGLLPPSHGVVDGGTDRLEVAAVPYLPGLLARAGWVTAAYTGGGYVSADYGFAAGFDRFASVDPFLFVPEVQERMGLAAVHEWIEDHADHPWFLFLHTFATHDYRPPAEDLALFDTRDGPPDARRPLQHFPGPDGRKDVTPTPEQLEDMTNLYDASVRYADRMLGQLVDSLDARGLLDETIVVITSDHGEEFGEHGGMRHARTVYRELMHVPLLVRMPGSSEGRVVREPVTLADLHPTLLDLLGVSADGPVDGRSLAGLLTDGGAGDLPPPVLLGHIDTHTSRRASLQVGPLKVVRGDRDEALEFPAPAAWELYDLRADPGEQDDLATARPDDLAALREHLETLEATLRARAAPGSLEGVDAHVLDQLRELGYVK